MSRATLSVSTMFFVNGFVFATWVPFIPGVKDRHLLSDADLGWVLLAMAAGAMTTLPLAGAWVGRHGSRFLTGVGAIGFCLALPLPLLAPGLPTLVLALVLFGALNALLDVAMNAQAVQVESGAGRAIMSRFHGLFSLGGLLGAGAAGVGMKADVDGLLYVFGVSLVCVATVSCMLPGLLPARADRQPGASSGAFALPSGALLGLGMLAFAGLMLEGAMADWSAVFLRDQLLASAALAAAGFAAFSGCMAAGRFAGDWWVNRLGPRRVLRGSAVVAAAGLVAAVVGSTPWLAIAGFGLVGLGASNIIPILFSAAGRMPGETPGRALAAVATTGYLGFLAGPPLIGWVAEWAGMRTAFMLLAVLCAVIAGRATHLPAHRS